MKNRREFLKTAMVAAGFGAGLNHLLASQKDISHAEADEKIKQATPYRIDVHHHIIPPEYSKALAEADITGALGVRLPPWSLEKTFEMMDRNGIQTAVTCISSPAVNIGDAKAARALARMCNEIAAKLISDSPQRFGAFATMPLPDVEGTLSEIEYALNTLKLDGIELLTNYNGKYLGDSSFEEVYRDLNRRKAVVHVHPGDPPGNPFKVSSALMEAPFDTTRTIANLICTGTVERYPDISFIFAHAGGTTPFLAERINGGLQFWPGAAEKAPKGFIFYLKRLYYDTALSANPYALPSLHALVDNSHILFGTDYPFAPPSIITANVDGLARFDGFDAEGRRAVEEKNALALFPRLRMKRTP